MSFILDALKKIDAQRRPSGDGPSSISMDLDSLDRERLRRRRQLASMAVIALLSAGATTLVLRMLSPRGEEPASGSLDSAAVAEGETAPPSEESPTPPESSVASASSASEPSRERPPKALRSHERVAQVPARETARPPSKEPSVDRAGVESPQTEPPEALSEPSLERPEDDEQTGTIETPPSSDPASPDSNASLSDDDATEEPATDDPEPEPTTPGTIRLVGQMSPERSASEASDRRPVPEQEPLPKHFPQLELQGTSVIDGSPVAVISDRRVFEGDTIDGARVIRIEERAVTLEFEGRRFTITL